MPENQAVFTEVLGLTIGLDEFQRSLKQAADLYSKFVQDLGKGAGDVVGIGMFKGLQDALQAVREEITLVNAENSAAVQTLVTVYSDSMAKIDAILEGQAQRQRARVKETVEATTAAQRAGEDAVRQPDKSQWGTLDRRVRNADEQEDSAHISALREITALKEKQAALEERIINMRVRPGEQEDAAHVAALKEEAAIKERLLALQERINAMRVRPGEETQAAQVAATREYTALLEKQQAISERLNALRVRPGEEIDAAHTTALKEWNTLKEKQAALEERIQSMRVRPGEEMDAAYLTAQREYNSLKERQAALEERINMMRVRPGEKVDAAQEQAVAENIRKQQQSQEQLNTAKERSAALDERILNLNARLEGDTATLSAESERLQQRKIQLLDEEATLRGRLGQASDLKSELEATRQLLAVQTQLADVLSKQRSVNTALNGGTASVDSQARAQQELNAAEERSAQLKDRLLTLQARMDGSGTSLLQEKTRLQQRINDLLKEEAALRERVSQATTVDSRADALKQLATAQTQLNDVSSRHIGITNELKRTTTGFFDEFSKNIVKSTAQLARFMIEWQLIIGVFDAFTAVIEAPFRAIEEGLAYLRKLQETQYDLLGPLLANVEFSKDLATNYKQAEQAASEIVRLVQDRAIAANVPAAELQRMTSGLIDTGALKMTGSLREVVTLAEMLAVSLKSVGAQGLAIQSFIGDLPKLFNGAVEGNNKLLAALNMTRNEWYNIREEAKVHGNLIELLKPKLQPYMDAVGRAQLSQAVMLEQFDLLKKRIEGSVAETIFDRINDALQRLNQWLKDNEVELTKFIKGFSTGLVEIVDQLAKLKDTLGGFGALRPILFTLSTVLMGLKSVLEGTVASVNYFVKFIRGDAFNSEKLNADWEEYKAVFSRQAREWKDLADTFYAQQRQSHNALAQLSPDQLEGLQSGIQSPLDREDLKNKHKDISLELNLGEIMKELSKSKAEYSSYVESIKEKSKELTTAIQTEVAARKISYADAATKAEKVSEDEIAALTKLKKEYEGAFDVASNRVRGSDASPQQKEDALADILRQRIEFQTAYKRSISSANYAYLSALKQAAAESVAIERENFKTRIDLADAALRQEDALQKFYHDQGYTQDVEFFDRQTEILKKTHDLRLDTLNDEIHAYAQGTKEHSAALNKRLQEEQHFDQQMRLRSAQRQQEEYQTFLRTLSYNNQIAQNRLEAQQTNVNIQGSLNPERFSVFNKDTAELYDARSNNLAILEKQKESELTYALAQSRGVETQRTQELSQQLEALHMQRQRLLADELMEIGRTTQNPAIRRIEQDAAIRREYSRLREQNSEAGNAYINYRDFTRGNGPNGMLDTEQTKELSRLAKAAQDAAARLGEFESTIQKTLPSFGRAFSDFLSRLAGFNVKEAWGDAHTTFQKFGVAANVAGQALANLGSIIDVYKQGASKGGVMGGVGAVMGTFSEALSAIPVVGQFMPAISGVLQFIGGLFTSAAKHIAEDAKKQFEKTVQAYQDGNATLVATISSLEQQRTDAIMRLSGKKGGKDQLDQLLPDYDREIVSLKKQQTEILTNFDDALAALRLQSDTLSSISKQWSDINKQVKDYISAGGDAYKAQAYLSLSLEQIQQSALAELRQGQDQTIQDAIHLNDLLQQRNDLNDQFVKQEFDIINADSIERRGAGSVERGRELADLRKKHQQELDSLNNEIALTNSKVEKERTVFDIASDIATLRQQSDALALQNLDEQIKKWNDLKAIVTSMSYDTSGFMGSTSPVLQPITINIGNINGTPTQQDLQHLTDSITEALQNQARMAP